MRMQKRKKIDKLIDKYKLADEDWNKFTYKIEAATACPNLTMNLSFELKRERVNISLFFLLYV